MIELNPPISISSGNAKGLITSISASHAKVRWDGAQPLPGPVHIEAREVGGGTRSFDCKIVSDTMVAFEEGSLPAAMDFLHVLRKGQHIDICKAKDVEHSRKASGFDEIELPVRALPETSWDDLDISTTFLGRRINAPVLITGMTGGIAEAAKINERLAEAASHCGVPMGVGSQRMAIENPSYESIFRLKDRFPDLFLIGNLGVAQLSRGDAVKHCLAAVNMIQADALAIHVNVLQELIQVEGDRDFRGVIQKIGEVAAALPVPVIVKEVGVGLDLKTASALWDVGVRWFDAGGSGGTSWAFIEGQRSNDDMVRRRGDVFRDFGIPTATAVRNIRTALPGAGIIATGGIRDGLVARKAIYAGANMVGIGLPLMRAAVSAPGEAANLLRSIITEYKIAVMCTH